MNWGLNYSAHEHADVQKMTVSSFFALELKNQYRQFERMVHCSVWVATMSKVARCMMSFVVFVYLHQG